jgi:hypothetical protein
MAMSHWKPLPADLPSAVRDLAQGMRSSLDEAGLSLRQFAACDDVHYSVTTLQRYFSGQAVPPPQLIEVISRRCGSDLHALHEQTRAGLGEVPAPAPVRQAGNWRWIAVAVVVVLGIGGAFGLRGLLADDTPEPRATGPDLVTNGAFDTLGGRPEEGLARWWVHDARVRPGSGLAQVAVPGGTMRAWDAMFGQSGITVTKGKRYVLRFTGWADRAVRIAVRVQSEEPPHTHALHQDVGLNSAQKHFDYPFTAAHTTGGTGQVVFQLGGNGEDYTIYFDNVALVEQRD